MTTTKAVVSILAILVAVAAASRAFAHGDMAPSPVDTTGLAPLGEEWRATNPYRGNAKAIEIGARGYNSNCARCHGLDVKSGGMAPDLRGLPSDDEGDAWFLMRIRSGAPQLRSWKRRLPFIQEEVVQFVRADDVPNRPQGSYRTFNFRIFLDWRPQPEPTVGKPDDHHPRRVVETVKRDDAAIGNPNF